ncbi:response regulator [Colwellia sp. 1_MG-2023]|uniref:response regulator n=1 Tax=Colwellia sp. 1_MG-2023 TaxID=3062649 RepID=UPI0026E38163|nr:response regulator [Colwellia sp. 1_MG-2023]MDO6446081.1 response regulator [Colwellia sp. 1_MG-2023]
MKKTKLPNNKRILLVEDNRISQTIILGVLANIYLDADIAENGHQALKMLKKNHKEGRYQLILMDCQMPELDGFETTQLIRSGEVGPQYQSIPIIALTANTLQKEKEKCLSSGMNDYTTKPVDVAIFQNKLCQWLGEREDPLNKEHLESKNVIDSPSLKKASTHHESWNIDDFMKRARNNTQLAKKLIDLFVVDTPFLINKLQVVMKQGKEDDIVAFAHKLKGSARDLGGYHLAEICQTIENNASEREGVQLDLHYKTLEKEFNLFIKELQRFRYEL